MSCLGIRRQTYCRGNDQAQSSNNERRESMPKPALALSRLRSSADVWIFFAFGLLFPGQLPHPPLAPARIGSRPSVASGKHRKAPWTARHACLI